jgi:BON domain
MKTRTGLCALILAIASALAAAQAPSGSSAGHSATSPDPQTLPNHADSAAAPAPNSNAAPDNSSSALQSRIADAIRNEPALTGSHVAVNVTDNSIDLTGTTGSSQDKQTVERIAQSFDGNRKLNDKIAITGHGHSDIAPDHRAINNGGTGNAPNPAMQPGTNNPPQHR